jgi:hypothetical protein
LAAPAWLAPAEGSGTASSPAAAALTTMAGTDSQRLTPRLADRVGPVAGAGPVR